VTTLRGGFDLAIALFGVAAWSFAAFVFGSRWLSPTAGGLIGVGLFLSSLALVVGTFVQDARYDRLAAGVCPRCRGAIAADHRHRRWEATRQVWLAPATTWECGACGFSHGEAWECPACPERA
jgi:hypothetical protein